MWYFFTLQIAIPMAIVPNRVPKAHPFFLIADMLIALHFTSDPYVYVLSRTKHSYILGCLKSWRTGLKRSHSDQSRLRATIEQHTLECGLNWNVNNETNWRSTSSRIETVAQKLLMDPCGWNGWQRMAFNWLFPLALQKGSCSVPVAYISLIYDCMSVCLFVLLDLSFLSVVAT